MRELVERGHIYIAQPPLYKAKLGKEERYLKDEHELNAFMLKQALVDAALHPGAGRDLIAATRSPSSPSPTSCGGGDRARVAPGRPRGAAGHACGVQVDLSRRDTAEASAEALEAAIGGKASRWRRTSIRRPSATRCASSAPARQRAHEQIDTEFVHSGDYAQIRQTARCCAG